jgi:hypothetical protein
MGAIDSTACMIVTLCQSISSPFQLQWPPIYKRPPPKTYRTSSTQSNNKLPKEHKPGRYSPGISGPQPKCLTLKGSSSPADVVSVPCCCFLLRINHIKNTICASTATSPMIISTTAYALPSPRNDPWKQSWQSFYEQDASYAAMNMSSGPRSLTRVPGSPAELVAMLLPDELLDCLLTRCATARFRFTISERIGWVSSSANPS